MYCSQIALMFALMCNTLRYGLLHALQVSCLMLFAQMIVFCYASRFHSVLGIIIFLCDCFSNCKVNVTGEQTCFAHFWMFALLGLQSCCLKNCLYHCKLRFFHFTLLLQPPL